MDAIESLSILFLVVLAVAAVRSVVYVMRLAGGDNRRRLFAASYGVLCDGAGHTGISVLCTDLSDIEYIADLLTAEYEHYEVVAAVDSVFSPQLLESLAERYGLVAVDCGSGFASEAVRGLYRSRSRRFRRLTVADILSTESAADLDTIYEISVYNYVMPVDSGMALRPHAVERLVAEICSTDRPPREVHSAAGAYLAAYLRDDVEAGGGFASGRRHFCPKADRRKIYEVLALYKRGRIRGRAALVAGMILSVAAASVFSAFTGIYLFFSAVAATLCVILSAAMLSVPYLSPNKKGWRAFSETMENFCEKILLKISQ